MLIFRGVKLWSGFRPSLYSVVFLPERTSETLVAVLQGKRAAWGPCAIHRCF